MNGRASAFLIACGAIAVAGSGSALARRVDRFAGLPGDVWRGVPIGLALAMLAAAIAILIRDRRQPSS